MRNLDTVNGIDIFYLLKNILKTKLLFQVKHQACRVQFSFYFNIFRMLQESETNGGCERRKGKLSGNGGKCPPIAHSHVM